MTIKTAFALGLALVMLSVPGRSETGDQEDDLVARALAGRLLSITGLLPSHALVQELRRLAADPAYPVEIRERALAEYAFGLRDYPPDPASWAGLELLSAYRERSVRPHPEATAYDEPRSQVATTARGTINVWLRLAATARTAADLTAGQVDFLDRADGRGHAQQLAGILDALRSAAPERLEPVRRALASRYPDDPTLAPIALAVAIGLGDEVLLMTIIEHEPKLRFKTIYDLDRYLDAGRAKRRWYEFAGAADPQRAAAAIAALADKTVASEDLFELLAARLADPEVGVAAAGALARVRLPDDVARLASMLNSDQPAIARRAALALKLNGSPAALAALRASPLPEVRQWLR